MNFSLISAKSFALLLVLFMYGCTSENVDPINSEASSGDSPTIAADGGAHPAIDPECSPRVNYPLMDESGGINVNYFGPFGNPTSPPTPWGSVEAVNSDEHLVFEIDLAYGWYIESAETFVGDESAITLVNGIPQVAGAWTPTTVNPIVSASEIWLPISSLPSQCFSFSMKLSVVRMDFFQGVDQASRTSLWVHNTYWNDPSQLAKNTSSFAISNWCIATCPSNSHGERGPSTIRQAESIVFRFIEEQNKKREAASQLCGAASL